MNEDNALVIALDTGRFFFLQMFSYCCFGPLGKQVLIGCAKLTTEPLALEYRICIKGFTETDLQTKRPKIISQSLTYSSGIEFRNVQKISQLK